MSGINDTEYVSCEHCGDLVKKFRVTRPIFGVFCGSFCRKEYYSTRPIRRFIRNIFVFIKWTIIIGLGGLILLTTLSK